jgi:hypothetical protein
MSALAMAMAMAYEFPQPAVPGCPSLAFSFLFSLSFSCALTPPVDAGLQRVALQHPQLYLHLATAAAAAANDANDHLPSIDPASSHTTHHTTRTLASPILPNRGRRPHIPPSLAFVRTKTHTHAPF